MNAQSFFDDEAAAKKYKRYLNYYHKPKLPGIETGKQAISFFLAHRDNSFASCHFAFRREFLTNIDAKFEEGIFYEDAPFNVYAMLNASRVSNSTDAVDERRVRAGSTVT